MCILEDIAVNERLVKGGVTLPLVNILDYNERNILVFEIRNMGDTFYLAQTTVRIGLDWDKDLLLFSDMIGKDKDYYTRGRQHSNDTRERFISRPAYTVTFGRYIASGCMTKNWEHWHWVIKDRLGAKL